MLVVLAFASATGAARPPGSSDGPRARIASPIQHVVVVFQENHSFDNVLGVLCAQNTTNPVRQPCDGTIVGKLYGGTPYDLTRSPDVGSKAGPRVSSATLKPRRVCPGMP